MVLDDSHEVRNKMTIVGVLFVTLTVIVGLHSLELDQQTLGENGSDAQDLQYKDSEYSGYGHPAVTGAFKQLLPRPPPSPVPLNVALCYACTDCPKALNSTNSKYCPHTVDPTKRGKCVVYAEHYRHTKKPNYIRGCASERGSCSDIRKAYSTHTNIVKLLNCYECEGDRCNVSSASLSLIDITMAFFAMVVAPLVAKYTLS